MHIPPDDNRRFYKVIVMELPMKMKYFLFLLGASTLTFAIQVPSSWQQEEKHDRSRYREIRPSTYDNPIQTKFSNGIEQSNGRMNYGPQYLLDKSSSSPVTSTVVHKMPKHANKKLVKRKFVSNGYPYKGSELKGLSSRKPFRPSIPERVNLEYYMTPKTNQQKLFSNLMPPRSQLAFLMTPDIVPQKIVNSPELQRNFDPYVSSQPEISNKQISRPNPFATNTIPTPVNKDQFFDTFVNRKPQTVQLHRQIKNLPSFTTSIPPVHNFDQHFNIPPSYESVELLQNTKIKNNLYNSNEKTSNSHNVAEYNIDPFVRPAKYLQANNLQNFDQNINTAKNHKPVEHFHNRKFENHLYKNYRDDRTHEPIDFDPFLEQDHIPEVRREESEKSPISTHEYPAEVPTKPIYPGPGQWARPGIRHRPFISKQQYDNLEKGEETPDGYDTFVEGEKLFNKLNGKFEKNLSNFPEKHNLVQFLNKKPSSSNNGSETEKKPSELEDGNIPRSEDGEEEEEDFIPTKLYAQVRRSENVEHLPVDKAEEPKLRESIKESKIQTVYTEEGYEDSAYDHAGHEKKVNNEEGFAELAKAKEKIEVKKVPDPKYNLHLKPKYEIVQYGEENELPTDEEIEQYKREELGLEDSVTDSEGSQSGLSPYLIGDEEETESQSKIPEKRAMKSNNNLLTTKEIKTMTMRENGNGDTETEISSRIKMILQPNNHTKTHEYVKIHPKVYTDTNKRNNNKSMGDEETIAKVEELPFGTKQISSNGIYIEEILSTTTDIPITTVPTSEFTVIFTEEIPITTLATTAISSIRETTSKKGITETLESIEKAFWSKGSRFRKKRFINDFPKIQVDTDFISKINHDLKEHKQDSSDTKYPYYIKSENDGINENSPLRYSENLKNIPVKKEGNMAFYEQADSMTVCPETETMLDPIPERIQNANRKDNESEEDYDEDEEGKVSERGENVTQNSETSPEQAKLPRLTGLDNKINCLKAKYFGKNPLDSPFFAEETVGTITPLFQVLHNRNSSVENLENRKTNFTNNDLTAENEIFGASDYEHEDGQLNVTANTDTPTTIDFEKLNKEVLNDLTNNIKTMVQTEDRETPSVQTVSVISLLTTPRYSIDLKPKHIYDQIQLLNHLPVKLNVRSNETGTNAVHVASNVENNLKEIRQGEMGRKPRMNDREEEEDTLAYDSSIASPSISENLTDDSSEGMLPDAEALKRRRKFKLRRKRPLYQTQGVNRIMSTTYRPIFGNHITASTVLPQNKVFSEVFYKNDIKPNEQLNVFTDILNNIRNSSQEAADALQNSSESETDTLRSNQGKDQSKLPEKYNRDSYLKAYSDKGIQNSYYASTVTSTTMTTIKPNVNRDTTMYNTKSIFNVLDNTHIRKDGDDFDKYRLYNALLDAKTKQNSGLATTTISPLHHDDVDYEAKTSKVMGLMPPGTHRYKTIYHPKRDNQNIFNNPGYMEKIGLNNFLVMGMKPPPKQRVYSYFDFGDENYNIMRRVPLRRGKRSTNQSLYAQLARNRGQEEHQNETITDDDDDDYVPHRPKNFYYDEKTGKIVYNSIKKPEEESDEDIEYVEIFEETPKTTPKSKPKQNPIFATATPPPEGQSYIDFVKKLKSAPGYKLIPDPTTTERGVEVSTEKVAATTMTSEPTEPPEFLSILGKVRQNSEYKFIEDKKEKEKVHDFSTESPEDTEVDEDDEISPTNVQNSPGGVQHDPSQGFQIFDISDYIPKLKNYLPRTSIDTSKYKTIHRSTVAPVLKTELDSEVSQTATPPISKTDSGFEETENSQTSNTNNRPVFIHTVNVYDQTVTELEEERTSSPSTTVGSTTIGTTILRKQLPIIQNRRRRPTTMRSVVTTRRETPTTSLSSLTTLAPQTEHHPKSRRNYRRRPTRIRTTTLSDNIGDDDVDDTTKVLRRRSNLYERKANEISKISTTARSITTRPRIEPKKYADILKKYSQTKRFGSNFGKNVNLETNTHQSLIESVSEDTRKGRDVEVIGEYNKDEKHGGNYKREDVDNIVTDETQEKTNELKDEVMIINLLPNYRNEDRTDYSGNAQVETSTAKLPNAKLNIQSNKPKSIPIKQKKPYSEVNKPVERLTDVVTKPETFYTDPSLPRSINLLMGIEALSSEEIESISEAEISDEDFLSDKESSPVEINTLKKPAYIEDPSKRLYYYAPI